MYNLAISKIAGGRYVPRTSIATDKDPCGGGGGEATGYRKVRALGCGCGGSHQGEAFGNFSMPVPVRRNGRRSRDLHFPLLGSPEGRSSPGSGLGDGLFCPGRSWPTREGNLPPRQAQRPPLLLPPARPESTAASPPPPPPRAISGDRGTAQPVPPPPLPGGEGSNPASSSPKKPRRSVGGVLVGRPRGRGLRAGGCGSGGCGSPSRGGTRDPGG